MISLKEILLLYKLTLESDNDLEIDSNFEMEKDDFVSLYEKFKTKVENINDEPNYKENLNPGSVFEISNNVLPITVAVIYVDEDKVVLALMSYAWELATSKDLFVKFNHPLGDYWIVQTDLIYSLGKKIFEENFYFVGNLSDRDTEILVDFYLNNKPLPAHKTGTGYNIPEKKEFKEIEYKRSLQIWELLKREIEIVSTQFVEHQEKLKIWDVLSPKIKKKVLNIKDYLKNVYSTLGEEPAFAASQIKPFILDDTKIFFKKEDNELIFLFPDKFVGKPIEIVFSSQNKDFPLFFIEYAPEVLHIEMDIDIFLMVAGKLKIVPLK